MYRAAQGRGVWRLRKSGCGGRRRQTQFYVDDWRYDHESSRQRSPAFMTFLFYAQEDVFETSQVIMIEPASGRTGNLQALLDSEIATMMLLRFAKAEIHKVW